MKRTIGSLAVAVIAAALAFPAHGTDEFYMARLQDGRLAYQSGSTVEAIDNLRIACFGLMDRPPLLSEGLVWLTMAQNKAGRTVDVGITLRRFLEVEKRLASFPKANLPADVRKDFEGLVARLVPPEVLVSTPSLAGLVETEEQKIAKLPPKERRRALEAKAKSDPTNAAWALGVAKLALEQGETKDAALWAGRVLEADALNVEARKVRASALMARHSYAEALADLEKLPVATFDANPSLRADRVVCLAAGKQWDLAREAAKGLAEDQAARPDVAAALKKIPAAEPAVVAQAQAASEPAAAAAPAPSPPAAATPPAAAVTVTPDDRQARKLLLEAACMSRDWKGVVVQARALEPFRDGEEPSMFYAAVGFFETGNKAEARPLMQRARTRISPTPFVNYYAERLLPVGASR